MLDLKTASAEDFAAYLHQVFTIEHETAGPIELELVEVDTRGTFDPSVQARRPFAILFVGEPEPALAQGIYCLSHAQLGTLELFLVPVALDANGMHYEAVFT